RGGVPGGDCGVRRRCGAALQLRRAAGRHEAQGRSGEGLRGCVAGRSGFCRLLLQPRAALRRARPAPRRHPSYGALPQVEARAVKALVIAVVLLTPAPAALAKCVATDGDSLVCDRRKIRLVNVYAAELKEPGGQAAKKK